MTASMQRSSTAVNLTQDPVFSAKGPGNSRKKARLIRIPHFLISKDLTRTNLTET